MPSNVILHASYIYWGLEHLLEHKIKLAYYPSVCL